MENNKNNNLTRFLLTFFLGWIGSIIINNSSFKPKGYKCKTLAYLFLSAFTFGIYGLVASISNLSFLPGKDNIGYERDYDYQQDAEQEDCQNYYDTNEKITYPASSNNTKAIIKKLIVAIMSVLCLLTLGFTLCESGYVENGFTFIAFHSDIIQGRDFLWAIYLIGSLNILFLLFSIVLLGLSIFNFFLKKHFNFNIIIIVVSMVIAFLYMIIGIVMVIISRATWGDRYFFNTSSYIPLILQTILLVAYILIQTLLPNAANDNKTQVSSSNNSFNQPKKITTAKDIEMLEKFANLKEKGIISQEEFDAKKKELLGN